MFFRAFFAVPSSLRSSAGIPTNATYGFALMFRKILAGKLPAMGAVVFDTPGKTFRDEKYPKYKAQRPRPPDELRQQIPWIKKVVEAHDFPQIAVEGFEADDVIGTLTRMAVEAGHEVYIVSGDKDFAQLIGEHVRMIDTMKDVTYDAELVRKKWGVKPEKFVDYLGLIGDKVDNIPGVPGVGPKTAKKLLDAYGDLETVLKSTKDLKGKQKERLEEHADDARLSKELATIDRNVPLEIGLEDIVVPEPDRKKIDVLYRELEFFKLLHEVETVDPADYELLEESDAVATKMEAIDDGAPVAVWPAYAGTVTHGVLLGVAMASTAEPSKAFYVPWSEGNRDALRGFLEDAAKPKVTHDLRDLWCLLKRHEISIGGVVGDTRLGAFLNDPTRDIPQRIDQVARRYLARPLQPEDTILGSGRKKKTLDEVELEKLAPYQAHIAHAIAESWGPVAERLVDEGQQDNLRQVSIPMARVLGQMQLDGIAIETKALDEAEAEFEKRKAAIEAEIYELAGSEFNIGSSKQLGKVLFDDLGLPVIKRTKTGYSTAADVLERLAPKHEIAAKIVDWRALAKLINTYTRVLRDARHPETGRVHCTFQQTTGASGRIITTDPDLQRTPTRTDDGKRIRKAFVPRDGWVLISADWSQIELRIMAHVSEDELLTESFQKGIDIHRRTAASIYGCAPEEVDATQRNVGKTVNFATIYGQGATALGQNLGVPRSEAAEMIEKYFDAYSGVREWLDEMVNLAHEQGYVETVLGRRRYIPELSSNNAQDRGYGERIATNTPIQGSGADICKLAMLAIDKRLRESSLQTKMLLQIHDELLFECPPEELEASKAIIHDCMENAYPLNVPLVVDTGHGPSWADAH